MRRTLLAPQMRARSKQGGARTDASLSRCVTVCQPIDPTESYFIICGIACQPTPWPSPGRVARLAPALHRSAPRRFPRLALRPRVRLGGPESMWHTTGCPAEQISQGLGASLRRLRALLASHAPNLGKFSPNWKRTELDPRCDFRQNFGVAKGRLDVAVKRFQQRRESERDGKSRGLARGSRDHDNSRKPRLDPERQRLVSRHEDAGRQQDVRISSSSRSPGGLGRDA